MKYYIIIKPIAGVGNLFGVRGQKIKKKISRAIHYILFTVYQLTKIHNVVFHIIILIINCNRGPHAAHGPRVADP